MSLKSFVYVCVSACVHFCACKLLFSVCLFLYYSCVYLSGHASLYHAHALSNLESDEAAIDVHSRAIQDH